MSGMLINLIIQIISGAIGGNVAGGAAKNIDLGTLGNTIAGAIGGGAGGQLLGMLIPLLANSASTPDIGSIVGHRRWRRRRCRSHRDRRRHQKQDGLSGPRPNACIIGSGHLQKSHLSAGVRDCINR